MTDEPKLNPTEDRDGQCELCGEWTDSLRGASSRWAIHLPFRGGNGKRKPYHMSCLSRAVESRLAASPVVQSEPASKLNHYMQEADYDEPPVPSRESTLPELGCCSYCGDDTADHRHDIEGWPSCGGCCGMHGEILIADSDKDRKRVYDWVERCAKNHAKTLSALTAARAQVAALEADLKRGLNVEFQRTNCCVCGIYKHTPVRNDELGGYICGGCLEKAYEELAAQVALLQQQEPRWRSVETELPPIDPALLATQDWWKESSLVEAWGDVTSFGDDIMLAHYDWSDGKWFDQHGENFAIQGITYWRPIDLVPPEGTDYGLYPSQVAARKTASPAPYAPPEKETGG